MQSLKQIVQIDQAIDDLKGVFPGDDDFNYLHLRPGGNYIASRWSRIVGLPYICTRAEFEARKAERQGKPSWDEHDYKFIHQGKNGHWYGSLKDNPASLPDMITDECWHYIEAASARRGEVFGDYRNTLEQRPSQIHPTGDLGRSSGTVGANHIGESDEKVSTYAEIQQAAQACERALNEFFPKVKLGNSADWYDYDKQEAIEKPPIGAECIVLGNVHARIIGSTASGYLIYQSVETGFCEMACQVSSFRPLDWDRDLQPNPEPDPSPELSFHLSNAFNELQASARLLPEDDPRRASIVSLAGGVGAVKEVA